MKKYDGSMMAYLNQKTADAAISSDEIRIEQVDFHDLVPNRKNFYGMREIEQLAHSMALSGNVTPLLVVRREDGKYNIISGERRYRAVKLRFERGEITSPRVPCQVRAAFQDDANGMLTADMRETIAIISANNYREKNALEKLEEIQQLEPIARIYYEENKEDGQKFRQYFAKEFLGISSSVLQNLLSLRKLTEESRQALQEGKVSDSLAYWLAGRPAEKQREYLASLDAGTVNGTVREAKKLAAEEDNTEEDTVSAEPAEEESSEAEDWQESAEDNESVNSDSDDYELTPDEPHKVEAKKAEPSATESEPAELSEEEMEERGQEKLFDAPIPENLSPENAEKEAMSWVTSCLKDIASMAGQRAVMARREGRDKEAAQWELRKAAVNLAIETIK